jgi:iron complex outermembrane receptor protein
MQKLLLNTPLSYRKLNRSLIIITDKPGNGINWYSMEVKGRITDAVNQPIQGVSVVEKGTNNGTSTDASGNFAITVTNGDATLVLTSVGFRTTEVPVNNRTQIAVTLEQETAKLNEVVVVGYGTQRRREVTSAVTTVTSEQFNKGNISDVAQLLQGKVAGLSIARTGGNPNGGFAIRLRGLSTLGANTSPLIVVDGQVGADINTVDPNDIQSIDVLKDAASAAIYGTRGSAGVIIITTKRGKGGIPQVSYNATVTAESPVEFTPNMSASEFVAAGGTDYKSNTDWYDEITRTGISHVHNLSLTGGNNGTSYAVSFNYRDNNGVAIKTGFNQLNGHFALTQKALKDKLTFNLDINATRRTSDFGFDEVFKYATIFNPTAPVRSTDPLYDLTGGGYFEQPFVDYTNPVAALEQNTNTGVTRRINFNGSATYEIIKGLKFLVRYAQQSTSQYNWVYLPKKSYHLRNFLGVRGFDRNGYAWKRDDESYNQLYENTLSYDTRFDKLNVSAVAGYSYQDFVFNGFYVKAGNFLTDISGEDFNSSLDFKNGRAVSDSYKNGSTLIAFFGRLNLNYNDIAFLSASLRREGSTQFGENNKWGMFPAVSAGFDFGKAYDLPAVNSLKLRASYGITGALPGGSYYSLLLVGPTGLSFYYNGNYVSTYEPTQNANPDLKWERKAEFDAGLDFALLNNRLTGSIDYYNRNTSDLIFNAVVPVPPFPTRNQYQNIGTLESKGIEIVTAYDVIRSADLKWNTSVNFSTYNVKLASLNKDLAGSYVGATNLGTPGQEQTELTRAVEGEKIGIMWGPVYMGLDANGKYQFDDGTGKPVSNTNFKTQIGNGLPKFELGWSNTFQYKNFDFSFFLRGTFGHDMINTYRAFYENPANVNSYNVVKTKYYNPALKDQQIFSSLFVEKASFVKLDNATLGYDFPLKNSAIKSLRAFVNAQNLFVITDYTGVDPEVRYADESRNAEGVVTVNVLAPGVDRRESWVRTRSFTLGVNLKF